MKVKTKGIIMLFSFLVLFFTVAIIGINKNNKIMTYADTSYNSKYTVTFDYENTYHVTHDDYDYSRISRTEKNITSCTMFCTVNTSSKVDIFLYCNDFVVDEILLKGGVIKSNSFSIKINSEFLSSNIQLYNENESIVAESYSDILSVTLSNGSYFVKALLIGEVYTNSNNINYWYEGVCEFNFTIESENLCYEGHQYEANIISPTCTEKGYTEHICIRCGNYYIDNEIAPTGHNLFYYREPPTCTDYGKIISHCQSCDYEELTNDNLYPTGHSYTSGIILPATCLNNGLRNSVCDICGDSYESVIPASGHSYEIMDIQSKNGNTIRTYTCSICGESYKQEMDKQYEEVASYVEYLFEQYEPYMWWVLLASAGIWSIVIGVMIAIAHKNEDKEKAKKMLVNYVIGLVVIAIIVAAAPYLIRGIAALIT